MSVDEAGPRPAQPIARQFEAAVDMVSDSEAIVGLISSG
jgi:hypothetical protein